MVLTCGGESVGELEGGGASPGRRRNETRPTRGGAGKGTTGWPAMAGPMNACHIRAG